MDKKVDTLYNFKLNWYQTGATQQHSEINSRDIILSGHARPTSKKSCSPWPVSRASFGDIGRWGRGPCPFLIWVKEPIHPNTPKNNGLRPLQWVRSVRLIPWKGRLKRMKAMQNKICSDFSPILGCRCQCPYDPWNTPVGPMTPNYWLHITFNRKIGLNIGWMSFHNFWVDIVEVPFKTLMHFGKFIGCSTLNTKYLPSIRIIFIVLYHYVSMGMKVVL